MRVLFSRGLRGTSELGEWHYALSVIARLVSSVSMLVGFLGYESQYCFGEFMYL